MQPKIVFLDLETLPDLNQILNYWPQVSNYPGLSLKANLNSIICVGYKILGQKKTYCKCAWDFPEWKKDKNNDRRLCEFLQELFKDAQAVVTHNGKRFDWKFLQTRMLIHELNPLDNIHHIDTKQILKSNLFLFNNKLNTAGKVFLKDQKIKNGGWDLWVKVHNDVSSAKKLMKSYCRKDVELLEKLYLKLRPFIKNIPNYNLYYYNGKPLCPNCGAEDTFKNGTRASRTRIMQRYQCAQCGTQFSVPKKGVPRI